jgi:SAM-dependent methyltransferase
MTTIEQLYDSYSDAYDKLVQQTNYATPKWIERKIEYLKKGPMELLDLGCANGINGKIIHKYRPEYKLTGIDISTKMVDTCKKTGVYEKVYKIDLNDGIPKYISKMKYDVILITGCLEFIKNHDLLFRQMKKSLKPKGQLWFTVQVKTSDDRDEDISVYSDSNVYEIMTKNDFLIRDFEHNPMGYIASTTKNEIPYFFIIAELDYNDKALDVLNKSIKPVILHPYISYPYIPFYIGGLYIIFFGLYTSSSYTNT